jgi:hypothetical protein
MVFDLENYKDGDFLVGPVCAPSIVTPTSDPGPGDPSLSEGTPTSGNKWPIFVHELQRVLCPTLYFSPFNFPKLIQLSGIIPKKLLIPER